MAQHSRRTLFMLAVLSAAATTLACAPRPAPSSRAAGADEVTAQLKRLDDALDRVEERLLASQGSISLWDELRDRHETASQVTCSNLSEHANAIAAYTDKQRTKRKGHSKNRLASREVAPTMALR